MDDRINGVSSPAIHRFLATEFRGEVVRAALLILALSLLVGAFLGLLVAAYDWGRTIWLGLETKSNWMRRGRQLGLLIAAVTGMYLYDVASRPALYRGALFERGGLYRSFQILIADGLGIYGVGTLLVAVLLFDLGLPIVKHPDYLSKLRQLAVAAGGVVLLGVGLSSVGYARSLVSVAQAKSDKRPNVLMLAADSLRPDRIDEQRAPHLYELGKHSTQFDRAITPLARTFPAWVSIATGQYPHHHGLRHMFPRWETRAKTFDTLGARFSRAGYHTAVVGDFAADIFRRIDLGYQTVNTPTFTLRELVKEHLFKSDPWLLAWTRLRFSRWLVPSIVEMSDATDPWAVSRDAVAEFKRAGERPFFLTVFFSTTHFPYATPSPYHAKYRASDYQGRYRYAKADDLSLAGVTDPKDVDQIRALYDGAVSATDDAIGELLGALKRTGQLENTIVVVTADHGEQLYEYGRTQGHGDCLEGDEALRVPLIIYDPRVRQGRRVEPTVSLVDVAPTILELAGQAPLEHADGRSLAKAMNGQSLAAKGVYSETGLWFTEVTAEVPLSRRLPYPDLTRISEVDRAHGDQIVIRRQYESLAVAAKHRMLESGNYRLIYVPTRMGPRFELYDRVTDPGFTRDVAHLHPEIVVNLKAELITHLDADPLVERRQDVLWPR